MLLDGEKTTCKFSVCSLFAFSVQCQVHNLFSSFIRQASGMKMDWMELIKCQTKELESNLPPSSITIRAQLIIIRIKCAVFVWPKENGFKCGWMAGKSKRDTPASQAIFRTSDTNVCVRPRTNVIDYLFANIFVMVWRHNCYFVQSFETSQ